MEMDAPAPPPAVAWAQLPEEAIVGVLSLLPLKERACAALVCKPWAAATLSPKLWKQLNLRLDTEASVGQVLTWLLPRGRELALLQLDLDFMTTARSWSSIAVLCTCMAASLRALDVFAETLDIGAWAAPLRGLRNARFEATGELKVQDMRTWPLPELETLILQANTVTVSPLWSSSLLDLIIVARQELVVSAPDGSTVVKSVPQVHPCSVKLRSLHLGFYTPDFNDDTQWRFPSELGHLEWLRLRGSYLTRLPQQLTELTTLRFLDLSGSHCLSIDDDQSVQVLNALPQLEVLDLTLCSVAMFPLYALSNTSLRILHLSDQRIHGQTAAVPLGACLPHLYWVSLDFGTAVKSLDALRKCENLRRLDLCLIAQADDMDLDAVPSLLRELRLALAQLPRLRRVHAYSYDQYRPPMLVVQFLVGVAALGHIQVTLDDFPGALDYQDILLELQTTVYEGAATFLELLEA